MSEFDWFMKICDWEFDHMDRDDLPVNDIRELWQQIAAHLKGWA